jgi:ATP-binding cassette subfamily B protein
MGRRVESMSITRIVRYSLVAVGPDRAMLAPVVVLSLIVGVLEAVLLYLVARLALALPTGADAIDIGTGPVSLSVGVRQLVLIAIGLVLALAALAIPLARTTANVSAATLVRLRSQFTRQFLGSSWAYRSGLPEGHLQDLVNEYCARSERLVQQLSTIVLSICGMSVLLVAAIIISPVAGIATLIGLGAVGLLLLPLARRMHVGANAYVAANKALSSQVAQTSRLSVEIATFRVEDEVERNLGEGIRTTGAALHHFRTISRLTPMLFQYGALGLVATLIGLVIVFDQQPAIVAPVLLLVIRALAYVKQLQGAVQVGNEMLPYMVTIESELMALRANQQAVRPLTIDHLANVSLEDVSFEYAPGQPVLRNVSLSFDAGEAIGLEGPSGGGKTTLTQLLLQLRQPTSGRISASGADLDAVAPACWGRLTSLVPQHNQLISGTVADNIRFHRPHHTDDQVVEAARAAHLHDEIVALPDGYATHVGPGARDLSGGQRQRLGIARALLGHPELLVLDEPTSALDHRSEHLIRQTLHELKGTTTLVIVAHRSSTLEVCDRIFTVRDGSVSEQPTPAAIAAAVPGASTIEDRR